MRNALALAGWCLVVAFTECGGYGQYPHDTGPIVTTCDAAVALANARGCHGICAFGDAYCRLPPEGCRACLATSAAALLHCGGGGLTVERDEAGVCEVDADVPDGG